MSSNNFFLIFTVIYGRVLIYHTENKQTVEKFDCVYYVYDDGEEISYCRRPGGIHTVDRNGRECENGGLKKFFGDLIDQEINPSNILTWSSSIEMVDLYAALFFNRSLFDSDMKNRFVCNCTQPGTFGKYCEYQLTHGVTRFSDAIKAQFQQKQDGDS